MADRRIGCHQCASYDREARRCRVGKSNPKRKLHAITIAELLGPQALCMHSPFREPLLLRMHAPHHRFVWAADRPPTPHAEVEVEILEDDHPRMNGNERPQPCQTAQR